MKSHSGEYIFMYQGHRLTASAIRSKLYRICKKIGVERKSPHKLRKTYHYNRKNAGKKIALLSNIDAFNRVSID